MPFKNEQLNKDLKNATREWCNKRSKTGGIPLKIGVKLWGRDSKGYDNWRRLILKKSGYKCSACSSTKKLHVHHIKSYSSHPKERTRLNNGLVLCFECHSTIHPWMKA